VKIWGRIQKRKVVYGQFLPSAKEQFKEFPSAGCELQSRFRDSQSQLASTDLPGSEKTFVTINSDVPSGADEVARKFSKLDFAPRPKPGSPAAKSFAGIG
jgi:hypothetical protein